MEGFPLALVAENSTMLELFIGGDLQCMLHRGVDFTHLNWTELAV